MYFYEINVIDTEELISNKYDFYAHLKGEKNKNKFDKDEKEYVRKETLKEHTNLCKKYFNKIIKSKKLDKVFLNFENIYFKDLSDNGKKVFREILINTIAFHDIGKINPYFQIKNMDNSLKENVESFSQIGTRHSIISAVLYIDYYLNKVLSLELAEKKQVRTILFLNAYVISKHHGNLDNFLGFLDMFYEGGDGVKVINIFENNYRKIYTKEFVLSENKIKKQCDNTKKYIKRTSEENSIVLYTYSKLLYSLLIACDFYATSEFMSGTKIKTFGELEEIDEFYHVYKDTEVYKSIRKYESNDYTNENKDLENEKDINILRNEMFLDTERELSKNKDKNIFFLEAPTGSGKSNVSMNLSFKLMEDNTELKKIFYVYPFNTLVEQNLEILNKTFGKDKEILNKIAIINSIFPIKMDKKDKGLEEEEADYKYYAKALLNRQFLNYPMILTTHVSLFNTMFGFSKECEFGFHQLANSIIVLDEIQSYKNIIWSEIISFLNNFAKVLNMKIIIMSATLPNLNVLINDEDNFINTKLQESKEGKSNFDSANLIKNREKYFSNSLFKDRVKVSYELMDLDDMLNVLHEHVKENSKRKNKILIEFIKKQSAYDFYNNIKEDMENDESNPIIELMTGDDNSIERKRILDIISSEEAKKRGIILISTQVIEAGVDIDMDIGYKDISKLDSDEQFMGRINRSCKRKGEVYFFNLDKTDSIYKNDIRVNTGLSLLNDEMREVLVNKDFNKYYEPVLNMIKVKYNNCFNESNLKNFFKEAVGKLNFIDVERRMKLIEEDNWNMSVYLGRTINKKENNKIMKIDGKEVWKEYKSLLNNNSMDYAEKQVKLSIVKSKMNYFIYDIKKNVDLSFNDKIGELYYIENGEQYFEGEKLNKEKFANEIGLFLDI
ncbi:CRISPR-associated helicase Cas3' [Clostridium botulinum]|uniref:CRISPR-associated helicase Cas3' n=2 Tax=Clostridium TaxID=1485 RepID=UPI001DE5D66A|nr:MULTISPECIES: CRISPR-associated helicase Cas3' [unclassified Clostridium]MBN1052290.1 CRISPR-associated helicase Cas3' [Clostridium botulinum]MBN1055421.1 CRISPR-associated helicase Cas3' [Clostridium botulinum]